MNFYLFVSIQRVPKSQLSTAELWPHFGIFQDWVALYNVKTTVTMLEVVSLFETLKVELEATVVEINQSP